MKHFVNFLWLMLLASVAEAQPANFMIGNLTFERPATWKWIEPVGPNEKARLYIFDAELKEKAIVSFETGNPDAAPSFLEKWKEPYLKREPPPVVSVQTNSVNHARIVAVDVAGTKMVGKEFSTNQATYGVVFMVKDEQVGARILGAKPAVEKLKPTLDQIIQEALKADE
jgi:hypothetical protein